MKQIKKKIIEEYIKSDDLARFYKEYEKKLDRMSSMELCNENESCNQYVAEKLNRKISQLLSQQKQEMVEEIEKELIWAGDELATEGDYGDFNKVLLNLKQKLIK